MLGELYQSCGKSDVCGARPGEQVRQAHGPVAEVGESHNHAVSDAQHLPQHGERVVRLLQRLAEDDVIERAVGVFADAGFDVALVDGDAAGNGALGVGAR